MCYKTALEKKAADLEKSLGLSLADPEKYTPYYHNDAFNKPRLYIVPQNNDKCIYPSTWGLIPKFVIESKKLDPEGYVNKYKTFNARGEEIFEKRSYKKSAASMRCLILADGFFEPHHYKGKSQPFFCYLEGRPVFAFAGIYTLLDEARYTCSLLTVEANDTFAKIHNQKKRMPLVLDRQFYRDWLSELNPKQVSELVETGFTAQDFKFHPVTNEIYKNRALNSPEAQKSVPAFDPDFNGASLF